MYSIKYQALSLNSTYLAAVNNPGCRSPGQERSTPGSSSQRLPTPADLAVHLQNWDPRLLVWCSWFEGNPDCETDGTARNPPETVPSL